MNIEADAIRLLGYFLLNLTITYSISSLTSKEEFHRFTGYYWAPPSVNEYLNDKIERILYIQISEAAVGLVLIPRPGSHGEVEEHHYPRAGL